MTVSDRPKVGVGVLITSGSCVLLGKRIGAAGSGTWAPPGGHLEFGESWDECARREVFEETGLSVDNVRVGTALNVVDEPTGYHYVSVFMVAEAPPDAEVSRSVARNPGSICILTHSGPMSGQPVNAEPNKCEGWHWCEWSDLPSPLFKTLEQLRAIGFDPFRDPGFLLPGAEDGAAKRQRTSGGADAVVAAAEAGLRALCDAAGIDESHGVKHACAVLAHAERALAAAPPLPPARALAVRLAALLHDADDAKYFPSSAKTYANAARLMVDARAPRGAVADALRMISLVSCSANGNSCPPDAKLCPELLWPRWADRLEATGAIGVVRCHQYNAKAGAPVACAGTPRPADEAAALALATPERFAAYQANGGGSDSMIDHYYDKLLQVSRPPPELVRNAYLEEAARERTAPLLEVCLAFGRDGEKGALAVIDALAARV